MKKKHHGFFADYVEDEYEEQEDLENLKRENRQRRTGSDPGQGRNRNRTGSGRIRTERPSGYQRTVRQRQQENDRPSGRSRSVYEDGMQLRRSSADRRRSGERGQQRRRESEYWDDAEIARRRRERDERNRHRKRHHPVRNIILIILLLLIVWVAFSVIRGNTGKEVTNILLIGQDRREGEGTERSDSMILATINRRTKTITLTSVMRDLYVEIPDHGKNRINEAYSAGGMKLLDQTIENNLHIEIDGNAEVDFDGFVKAMTSVGNLDINLKDYEAEYLNVNSSYGGVENYAWNLHAGMNSLTPRQALAYSRIRYVGNSDWERTERQRTVITAAFNKIKKKGPVSMMVVASKIFPCLTTDMSKSEMMGLASSVVLNNMKIGDTLRIPFDGTYHDETLNSGAEVLVADMDKNAELLRQHLYG